MLKSFRRLCRVRVQAAANSRRRKSSHVDRRRSSTSLSRHRVVRSRSAGCSSARECWSAGTTTTTAAGARSSDAGGRGRRRPVSRHLHRSRTSPNDSVRPNANAANTSATLCWSQKSDPAVGDGRPVPHIGRSVARISPRLLFRTLSQIVTSLNDVCYSSSSRRQ